MKQRAPEIRSAVIPSGREGSKISRCARNDMKGLKVIAVIAGQANLGR